MGCSREDYEKYVKILKEELIPAMGCTEPIALAYAAAKAKELLGEMPIAVTVKASGSIIKNVKSVVVPNTGHMKGIGIAAAAGIVSGDPERELQVIAEVSDEQRKEIQTFAETVPIKVEPLEDGAIFDILVELQGEHSESKVRIRDYHTNISYLEKDGEVLLDKVGEAVEENLTDRSFISMEGIWDFVNQVNIDDVKDILKFQMECNWAIAQEGLKGNYGANIGSVLLDMAGDNLRVKARAMAAAGSDARMDGCELPVVINSGSGNQGITVSVPVLVYAKGLEVDEDKMYRALLLANLTAIHEKTGVGRLSAYCGAVCAGSAAGAGIAYLQGGTYDDIIHTVVNSLAIVSGIVCDGAKPSCAAKIASAVEAGILGYEMYKRDQQFRAGDGIVAKGVEKTIANVGKLAKYGMFETNREIIRIMTE